MKKNRIVIFIICIFVCVSTLVYTFNDYNNKKDITYVKYNGNNLKINVDGKQVSMIPVGHYYLTNYKCNDSSIEIDWDSNNGKISLSNVSSGVAYCDLEFESNPLLSKMPIGSYVEYIGLGGTVGEGNVMCQNGGAPSSTVVTDETEAPNSCNGQNAREDLDKSNYTYGYCSDSSYKYYATGWRIAYVKDGKAKIVSAGAPECLSYTGTSDKEKMTFLKKLNALALKYCNMNYVDGDCSCVGNADSKICDSPSNDAWAMNDADFYYITKKLSGYGKRLSKDTSVLGDSGGTLGDNLYCLDKRGYKECGYNSDLLDNGGNYLFGLSSFNDVFVWSAYNRGIKNYSIKEFSGSIGFRPVINLSSDVVVIGGNGTMDNPYKIAVS